MEICIHAGLHKSGTTTVQYAFAAAFGKMGRVWYPVLGHPEIVNHAPLVWPFLIGTKDDPHYDTVVHQRLGGPATFQDAVETAAREGVEKLVISCETLDILSDFDVAPLREACLGHPVRVIFTVTPPLHRWASAWQELVRHGFGAAPAPAAKMLADVACLTLDRIAGLVTRFPADRKYVRIVSRSSVDPNLVQSVADALGLGPVGDAGAEVRNEGLGENAVLLAYLNSRGITNGVFSQSDRTTLERHRVQSGGRRVDDFSPDDFAVPQSVIEAADAERRFLIDASQSGAIVVDDPAGQLNQWSTGGLPSWYVEARDGAIGPGGLLREREIIDAHWRHVRRTRSAEASLGTAGVVEGQLRLELERARRQLERTTRDLRILRDSRSWRWASAVRRFIAPAIRLLRRSA